MAEQGTHDELLALNGVYAELHHAQAEHAQRGFRQHENRNRNPELREQHRPQVGHDVVQYHSPIAATVGASEQQEVRIAHGLRRSPNDAQR